MTTCPHVHMSTCSYVHMSTRPYGHMDIRTCGHTVYGRVDIQTYGHNREGQQQQLQLANFCLIRCFVCVIPFVIISSVPLYLLLFYVSSLHTFCRYTLCHFIPFVVIHFIFLYVLSLYVLSLYTFCCYTFCRYTFCLFIPFVVTCFVSLYLLSLYVMSFDVLSLCVLLLYVSSQNCIFVSWRDGNLSMGTISGSYQTRLNS